MNNNIHFIDKSVGVCYCSGRVTPKAVEARNGLTSSALGGVIAAGAAVLLLLIAVFVVLLLFVSRRRRLAKATYKASAHDNPTYMTHRDLNANLAAAAAAGISGSPIDLMFDADGAIGVTFYADDEKKKVI